MNKQLLLIDGNPLMWRAVFSKGESFVTEGILSYFFRIIEKFEGADTLVFWDEGKSRWRSEYYPEYKMQREDKKKELDLVEMGKQKKQARDYLSNLGVKDFVIPGVEADDLLTWFSEYFSKIYPIYDRVIIVTRDHDLWQLINDKVFVYDSYSNELIDTAGVDSKEHILPNQIVDAKSLAGDRSDNIEGIKGVGAGIASKLLDEYTSVKELWKPENRKDLQKKKRTASILENPHVVRLAHQLVKLPELYEASAYLSPDELTSLFEQIDRTPVSDPLRVQVETDLYNLSYVRSVRHFSSLTEELQGIKAWLAPKLPVLAENLTDLNIEMTQCNRCPLRSRTSEVSLPYQKGSSQIMVVTRQPDQDLVGTIKAALGLENFYATYVTKCKSEDPATYGQMLCCSSFLRAEIQKVKPSLIIAMGTEAMSMLTPYSANLLKHCGEILHKPSSRIGQLDADVAVLIDPDDVSISRMLQTEQGFGLTRLVEYLKEKSLL